MTPTQRTLALLRDQEWPLIEVVERWNPYARRRQDLFGIVDILAVRPGETLAIQTTTASSRSNREHKIADSPAIGTLREAGWTIHLHGWGKRSGVWTPGTVDLS